MGGIGAERGGMDARKRDDTYHRGRGGRYIGHSPTAGTLGSCHSPGPMSQGVFLCTHGRAVHKKPTGYQSKAVSPASLAYRGGAMPNFALTEFSEVRNPQATPKLQQRYAKWGIRRP